MSKSPAAQRREFLSTLKSARLGLREAQYEVALMFANGIGVKKNVPEAVEWVAKAAEKGLVAAQYLLGTRYLTGAGVTQDTTAAFWWLQCAARQNHPKAWLKLGVALAEPHLESSISCLSKAAELSVPEAQYLLGQCFALGRGTSVDPDQAKYWFERAASQHFPPAEYALGHLLYSAEGLRPNFADSLYWLRRSAKQLYAPAQVALAQLDVKHVTGVRDRTIADSNWSLKERRELDGRWASGYDVADAEVLYSLGKMHEFGWGVEANIVFSQNYYLQAANLGHAAAQYMVGKASEREQFETAVDWYRKAAKGGNPDALWALGRSIVAGVIPSGDLVEGTSYLFESAQAGNVPALISIGSVIQAGADHIAAACFEKASQLGSTEAKYHFGMQLLSGSGVKRDIGRGFSLLEDAAEMWHLEALCELGVLLLGMHDVAPDRERAFAFLQRAAIGGLAKAQWNLGALYLDGSTRQGVNFQEAFKWCKKAADQEFGPAQATMGNLCASKKRYSEAADWWSKAAAKHDPEAQYNLGLAYGLGRGVEADLNKSLSLLCASAEQGVAAAQAQLGVIFAKGEGVAEDPIESHKWFMLAANGGNNSAKQNLKSSEKIRSSLQQIEAKRRADAFLKARESDKK